MTGIARKNVNSEATVLDTPISNAPTIVAPDLEVPGKIAAMSWNTPIISAVWKVMSSSLVIFAFFPLLRLSMTINATPNTISAIATENA